MVEGMEKEKRAMRKSSTSTVSTPTVSPAGTKPPVATNAASTEQMVTEVFTATNNGTNDIKSADALLNDLLYSMDEGNSKNGSEATGTAINKLQNNNTVQTQNDSQNSGNQSLSDTLGKAAASLTKGIEKNRTSLTNSTSAPLPTKQAQDNTNLSYVAEKGVILTGKSDETQRIKLGTVYFSTGSAQIDAEAHEQMEETIATIKATPQVPLIIEGHTDNSGTGSYNSYLAHARANAVKQYLVSKGIDGNKIVTFGFAENAPVLPNSSPREKAYNRRALIIACPEADRISCGGAWTRKDDQEIDHSIDNVDEPVTKAPAFLNPPKETKIDRDYSEVPVTTGNKAHEILERIRNNREGISSARSISEAIESEDEELPDSLAYTADNDNEKSRIDNIQAFMKRSSEKLESIDAENVKSGDALRVKVAGHEELDKKVMIPPSGMFSYNLISDFYAIGKSIPSLTKEVSKRLGTYILNARTDIRRIHIIKVLGLANKKGQFEFNYEPDILDVITMAGGLVPLDNKQNSYVARVLTNDGTAYDLDLTTILETGLGAGKLRLFHGDTLIVNPAKQEKVYVMGSSQVTLLYKRGMRLLDAISLSSGNTAGGPEIGIKAEEMMNIKNLRILRKTKDGHVMKIIVNLHDIIHQGRIDRNIELCAGDYVIFPKRSKRNDTVSLINSVVSPLYQTIGLASLIGNVNN
jgi:outer membrane protein OmpA-like peptidoglycan-associated protein/protein involved in polysaccharide export with SLBB domain